ncbi:hypothetical protein EXS74_01420 [Candidatus Woesearchaeota archaeon]|nr:hypothetical protein [Candidatus Woesearchaeota archaeon]
MKRGVLFLVLIALLVLPLVSATVSITNPSKAQYNVGEEIDLSGYIQETNYLDGQLQISLVCGTKTYKLQAVDFSVSAQESLSFSDLSLPSLTASSSMQGICKLKADILVNGATAEITSSSSFEITKSLDGTFSLDQSQIQLGDTITLTASITNVNNQPIDGTAEIYFETGGEEYMMDFVDVTSGSLTYSSTFTNGNAGSYKINLIVRDSYGNEQQFDSAESFTVLDDLEVTLSTNAQSFSPGDVLNVYGDVRTLLQGYVDAAVVEISLDETTVSTSLSDSKFTQDILISTTITSGQHTLSVDVEDSYGNSGSSTMTIQVDPQATTITNSISNTTLNPEENVNIGVVIYDQAGDVMTDSVHLDVYDSNNNIVSQTTIASEEDITYKIPQFASPGQWLVKSYYLDDETEQEVISDTDSLTINAVQKIDYNIVGTMLYITNVGNVKYTDDFSIEIAGVDQDYLVTKTKNLGVNETITIDLSKELPSGSYSVSIPTGYGTAEQNALVITDGKVKTALSWPYTIIAILIILILAFIIYSRVRPKKEKKQDVRQDPANIPARKNKEKKIRLYDPKREAEKLKKKGGNLTFEDKQHNLEDFKQRTLEEIRKTEEKIQKDSKRSTFMSEGKLGYVTGKNDPQPKPKAAEEKPSVFNLFDQ